MYLNFTNKFKTPHQDVINCFLPSASIGLLPIKYNLQEYIEFENTTDELKGSTFYTLNCSYYYLLRKNYNKPCLL